MNLNFIKKTIIKNQVDEIRFYHIKCSSVIQGKKKKLTENNLFYFHKFDSRVSNSLLKHENLKIRNT